MESEVATLAAEGLTNPQIAQRMYVSRGTVKNHLSHIYKKLDVRNRVELTATACPHPEPGSSVQRPTRSGERIAWSR